MKRLFVLIILSSCTLRPKVPRPESSPSSAQMIRLGASTCLAAAAFYQIYHHRALAKPPKGAHLRRQELVQDFLQNQGLKDPSCLEENLLSLKEGLKDSSFFSREPREAKALLTPSLQILCADYLELTRPGTRDPLSERQALLGCQGAIYALATRKPFDTSQTKHPDDIGYHVTTEKNLDSILKVGLLPHRGGYGGLCQNLSRLGETLRGMEGEDFAERAEGFVHWTQDLGVARKFMDDYRRCQEKPVLLALRAQALKTKSQHDPCMPPEKAYRTEQWVYPVDIQVIKDPGGKS